MVRVVEPAVSGIAAGMAMDVGWRRMATPRNAPATAPTNAPAPQGMKGAGTTIATAAIKSGNPNGTGLPSWPVGTVDASGMVQRIRIDVETRAEPEPRARYLFQDGIASVRP